MSTDALLQKAHAIREQEHRLEASLRLKTLEDVVGFIHSKGLVSMLGGNELPGLISAILGRPWKPTGKGFTSWLEWWSIKISGQDVGHLLMEIPRREDIVGTRVFRNSKTFVSKGLWPILDPIVQQYARMASKREILSELEWKILDALKEEGASRTDRLRSKLKLEGKRQTARFHRALSRLENHGLIIGFEDPNPEKHLHAAIWHLWSRKIKLDKETAMSYERALAELVEKTVDASVVVEEKEVARLYSWNGGLTGAKDELVDRKRVLRSGRFLFAPRVAT